MSTAPLLQRIAGAPRDPVPFEWNGQPCVGQAGDTILTAVLTQAAQLRTSEQGQPRAGFCYMGACQDCWVWSVEGQRLRACTEPLRAGQRLRSHPPGIGSTP